MATANWHQLTHNTQNRPTRITPHSATIIDNIFTNNHEALIKSYQGILVTDLSDHFPVFHINQTLISVEQDVFIVKRSFTAKNKLAFLEDLGAVDWQLIYNWSGTQAAFSQFHQKLLGLYDKNFPKRKIKLRYNNRKPWLSEGLRYSIKQKNKLYYKSIKCKTAYNEIMYTTYRNELKHILLKAEKDHYASLLESYKSNMKKTWGILKETINKNKVRKIQEQFKLSDGSVTSNKLIISEKFNEFFINIGPTLAKTNSSSIQKSFILFGRQNCQHNFPVINNSWRNWRDIQIATEISTRSWRINHWYSKTGTSLHKAAVALCIESVPRTRRFSKGTKDSQCETIIQGWRPNEI